jgi:hypothetical protein
MVGVRCHLSSLGFDTSKPCDSHPIVMRKEWRGAALPERTCRALVRKRKLGRLRCYRTRRVFCVNVTKSK